MRRDICVVAVAIAASCALTSMAPAETISGDPANNPDQELGRPFLIKAENLPPPKSGSIAASRSLVIPYAGQAPRVGEGFTVTPFITGLEHPRRLLVLPNNDVIVAEQKTGYLTLLRDQDGDGKADYIERYADDFKAPYGLAYQDGFVLVADQEGIELWRNLGDDVWLKAAYRGGCQACQNLPKGAIRHAERYHCHSLPSA